MCIRWSYHLDDSIAGLARRSYFWGVAGKRLNLKKVTILLKFKYVAAFT